MIKDSVIEKFARLVYDGKTVADAARRVGICYSTAMKYNKAQMLPSDLHRLQVMRMQRLFDDQWEKDIVPQLVKRPNYSANELLTLLVKKNPHVYKSNMLRTLQKRIRDWKNHTRNMELEPYKYNDPGEVCVVEYIAAHSEAKLRSQPVPGLLVVFYLPYSKWISIFPVRLYNIVCILGVIEDAFWELGGVPRTIVNSTLPQTRRTLLDILKSEPKASPDLLKNFGLHYNLRTIEEAYRAPEATTIRAMINDAFNEKWRNDRNSLNFETFDKYREALKSISKELNSNVEPKLIYEERKAARSLPQKGFTSGFSHSIRTPK